MFQKDCLRHIFRPNLTEQTERWIFRFWYCSTWAPSNQANSYNKTTCSTMRNDTCSVHKPEMQIFCKVNELSCDYMVWTLGMFQIVPSWFVNNLWPILFIILKIWTITFLARQDLIGQSRLFAVLFAWSGFALGQSKQGK